MLVVWFECGKTLCHIKLIIQIKYTDYQLSNKIFILIFLSKKEAVLLRQPLFIGQQ
jgi:hypothetical protein